MGSSLPIDHPLTPFVHANLEAIRTLYWTMLLLSVFVFLLIVAKAALIMWLLYRDRRQDKRDSEFYHTIRNTLAPISARLQIVEEMVKNKTGEIKHEVHETSEKTADKVVERLTNAKSDSGVIKTNL